MIKFADEVKPKIAFPYTEEQLSGINAEGNLILFEAHAGTGKTTLLIGFAEARPDKKVVYLAFNSSVKDEAKERFPKNVKCMTGHGLAYQKFGIKYKHKLANLSTYQVAK